MGRRRFGDEAAAAGADRDAVLPGGAGRCDAVLPGGADRDAILPGGAGRCDAVRTEDEVDRAAAAVAELCER